MCERRARYVVHRAPLRQPIAIRARFAERPEERAAQQSRICVHDLRGAQRRLRPPCGIHDDERRLGMTGEKFRQRIGCRHAANSQHEVGREHCGGGLVPERRIIAIDHRGTIVRPPPKLRERIAVARNLAVYGFFCYEFHAVSLFWSVSCIEMALNLKFEEVNPGPFELRRKLDNEEEKCWVALADLEDKLRMKWRIADLSFFDYSFKALLMWAFRKAVLPDDIEIPVQKIVNSYNNRFALKVFKAALFHRASTLADIKACWDGLSERQRKHYQAKSSSVLIAELPRFRNMMAHPKQFNLVTPPGSPLSAFQLLTDIVSRLWPESHDSHHAASGVLP